MCGLIDIYVITYINGIISWPTTHKIRFSMSWEISEFLYLFVYV